MIIDAHAHIFPDKIAEKAVEGIGSFYPGLTMHMNGKVGTLIDEGAKCGIEKFLVHSVATTAAQVESINNFIAECVKTYPDKLIGFAAMHPDYPNVASEIDRAVSMGLKGIKLHPDFQQFNIDDERAMKIYEAAEGRVPVLIHMGDHRYGWSKPHRLVKVLENFPKLDVIGAHFGGWSEWNDAEKELAGRRLWVDTSSSLYAMTPERAAELIHKFGADKVMFGTDYPMWTAKDELEMFYKIPLTDEEREMVLHKNAEKLLHIAD